jgi:hypothetical protein
MQIRLKVEIFGDKEKITTESTETPIGEGIIVGDLNIPKGTPVSIKMPSILDDVRAAILVDSMPDPRD